MGRAETAKAGEEKRRKIIKTGLKSPVFYFAFRLLTPDKPLSHFICLFAVLGKYLVPALFPGLDIKHAGGVFGIVVKLPGF